MDFPQQEPRDSAPTVKPQGNGAAHQGNKLQRSRRRTRLEPSGRQPLSSARRLADRLGQFSIGLGLLETFAPRLVTRSLGLEDGETIVQAYGVRELATGIGILASSDPTPFVWGRVAGDGLDMASLMRGMLADNSRKGRLALGLGLVVGVTAIDLICAEALQTDARHGPVRDYSDRSGLPKPPEQMRGAAREEVALKGQVPRDLRSPQAA